MPHMLNTKLGTSLITRQLKHLNQKGTTSFIQCRSKFGRSYLKLNWKQHSTHADCSELQDKTPIQEITDRTQTLYSSCTRSTCGLTTHLNRYRLPYNQVVLALAFLLQLSNKLPAPHYWKCAMPAENGTRNY